MLVSAIMSGRVVAIRSDCDLSVAVDAFIRWGEDGSVLHHLVVVDPDRTVCGLLSADQVLAALVTPGPISRQQLSTPTPVRPGDEVRRAAELMLDELVDALPVAEDDGRLVGVVTWRDIVAYAAGRELRGEPVARP